MGEYAVFIGLAGNFCSVFLGNIGFVGDDISA